MKKLTAKQQDIVRKMQDGRQLIRHKLERHFQKVKRNFPRTFKGVESI